MEFEYLKTTNILYVEDDASIQEGYIRTLKRCAKELFVASNGLEGIKLFKKEQNHIDIVITDIKMPKLNGIEMVKQIQEIKPHIPIVFTSAHSDSSYLFEALDIQAESYLLKPVPVKKLMMIINKISKNISLERINQQNEEILHQMRKMTAVGEMIGNIAHQWRQPLSIISSATSGLKLSIELETPLSKEEMEKSLDYIVDETLILSKTIDDFRDFFKGQELVKVDFTVKELYKRLHYLLLQDLHQNIRIIKDVDMKLALKGNQNLLIQAFINILNNALFALEKVQKSKLLFISIKKSNNEKVEIKIKDNAGGVLEEALDKVFEPYFTTKHKSIDTGLGLF